MDPQRVSVHEEPTNPRTNASLLSTDDALHHGMGDMTLAVGDYVVLNSGQSGVIRFIGSTSFSSGEWVGVELDDASGKNDGSVRGNRYFECSPNHGMFLRRSALARCSSDKLTQASVDNQTAFPFPTSLPAPRSPRPDEQHAKRSFGGRVKKNIKPGGSSGSPPVDNESSYDSALNALRQELADASEDHDVERLRWVVPVACKAGVPSVEVEAARRILEYEASHHHPAHIDGMTEHLKNDTDVGSDMQADKALVAAIREELESTSKIIRNQMAEMVLELRQDFAVLRGEFRAVALSSGSNEKLKVVPQNSAPTGSIRGSIVEFQSEVQSNEVPQLETSSDARLSSDDSIENRAARRLLAVVRGGEERREQRRREAATNVIQRCVKKLRHRWEVNAEKQKACSFAAVAHAARSRNKEWAFVFDKCREGQDGLKREGFIEALRQLLSHITTAQCEALFGAYTKGTQKTSLDFRVFARMLEALHTSDRCAAEFADMTLEAWMSMAQPHVVKTKFTKTRGGAQSQSRVSLCAQPIRRSALERTLTALEEEIQIACPSLDFNPDFPIYNINLHEANRRQEHIQLYYKICSESLGLLVTTSCFSIWRKNNKTNGFAKLIPAVPMERLQSNKVRIFFFDDNLDMIGHEDSVGICNLRDIRTGDFIDFSVGSNGFRCEHAGRHTIIHASDVYRNVLVKANILDAIEDKDYFSSIISRYSEPGEKIIVFMDVNSTISCNDTVQGKDLRGTLFSTMFEFMVLQPRTACDFVWDGSPPIRLEKPLLVRSLVKELTKESAQCYSEFWKEATCLKLLDELMPLADLRWCLHEGCLTREVFNKLYSDYMVAIERDVSKEGITSSWFECFKQMKADHTVILNSFGIDTQKVVIATGLDETNVLQIAVNYDLWDARDKQKFESLFKSTADTS